MGGDEDMGKEGGEVMGKEREEVMETVEGVSARGGVETGGGGCAGEG